MRKGTLKFRQFKSEETVIETINQ